ncbi:MAG: flagellar basal body protein [Nitrospinota bacterium]
MNSIFSIALSALGAFGVKLNSIASNVANINTEDYRQLDVSMSEGANGGVRADITRSENSDSVDLSNEIVEMIVTEIAIKANLKVIKEEDEIIKKIVDIKA